jgi:DNA-binding PadR family transcriptional regulator
MTGRKGLGEFEHLVLLAVLRLGERAFGPEISAELEESTGRSVTRGALYSTLNRLEDKGFLSWTPEEAGENRGGHIRRAFAVTPAGLQVLRKRRGALRRLWAGVEAVLDGGSQ